MKGKNSNFCQRIFSRCHPGVESGLIGFFMLLGMPLEKLKKSHPLNIQGGRPAAANLQRARNF